MSYITSVERIGYDRGTAAGEQSLIVSQLECKFGELPTTLGDWINDLSVSKIQALGKASLDCSTIADLTTWLDRHSD